MESPLRTHAGLGRLTFIVTYHRSGSDVNSGEVQRKIVGSVDIQNDSVQAIVPVTKVTAVPIKHPDHTLALTNDKMLSAAA